MTTYALFLWAAVKRASLSIVCKHMAVMIPLDRHIGQQAKYVTEARKKGTFNEDNRSTWRPGTTGDNGFRATGPSGLTAADPTPGEQRLSANGRLLLPQSPG